MCFAVPVQFHKAKNTIHINAAVECVCYCNVKNSNYDFVTVVAKKSTKNGYVSNISCSILTVRQIATGNVDVKCKRFFLNLISFC